MKKKLGIVISLGTLLLFGCSGSSNQDDIVVTYIPESITIDYSTPGPTPPIPDFGKGPTYQGYIFPNSIDCSVIVENKSGMDWQGARIGVTTFEEFSEIIGPHNVLWSQGDGNLRFFSELTVLEREWDEIRACFIGNRLSAIRTWEWEELPRTLDRIIEKYGFPDRSTWGWTYWHRTLIWPELGLMVQIDIETEKRSYFTLFPPIPTEGLENSWLIKNMPKEGDPWVEPEYNIDTFRLPPEKEVEDPWGFNQRD